MADIRLEGGALLCTVTLPADVAAALASDDYGPGVATVPLSPEERERLAAEGAASPAKVRTPRRYGLP